MNVFCYNKKMILTSRLNNAIRLASRLHRTQTRRDRERTPYISHLYAVATLIGQVTEDEDIVIAGIMHDSLEDVPGYTYSNLVSDCGERVAEIVKHVTEPLDANKESHDQLPWLERKEAYLINLKEGGTESAIVSAADKIHNTESFLEDLRREGQEFLSRFESSLENKMQFHERVLTIVEEKLGLDHPLVSRLRRANEELRGLVHITN